MNDDAPDPGKDAPKYAHNPGRPRHLRLADLELTAFAISGLASYVLVPSFDLCFDLGHCSVEAAKLRNVFLSHVHQDHSMGVPRHMSLREMWSAKPSRVWCPEESADDLRAVLDAVQKMEGRPPRDRDAVVGVRPGDSVALGRHRVEVFDVTHRIASRGFTLVERRRSLKPDFVGLPGTELGALRARGVELHDHRDHRRLTYVGDSTLETLKAHANLGDCDVLFLEATYLPPRDPVVPGKWGHSHLSELVALFLEEPSRFGRAQIVLKHFSMKYAAQEVRAAAGALPPELRSRVTFLV